MREFAMMLDDSFVTPLWKRPNKGLGCRSHSSLIAGGVHAHRSTGVYPAIAPIVCRMRRSQLLPSTTMWNSFYTFYPASRDFSWAAPVSVSHRSTVRRPGWISRRAGMSARQLSPSRDSRQTLSTSGPSAAASDSETSS